jgi:hypothetical protein
MKKAQRKAPKAVKKSPKKMSPVAKKAASPPKARARAVPARKRPTPPAPFRDFSADINQLVARLRTLEDIMEISRLKAAYCEAVDGGWDRRTHRGEAVASLFVADGVWDAGQVGGRGEGHEGIAKKIDSFQQIPFALHRVSNPDIRINGDEATGKWHVIAYLSQPDGTPVMFMGTYRDKFVRTPQGWKFKHLGGAAASYASLRDGWGIGEYYKQNPVAGPDSSADSQ